jgi:hypothetical protein
MSGSASFVTHVNTSSPISPSGRISVVSGLIILGYEVIFEYVHPLFFRALDRHTWSYHLG